MTMASFDEARQGSSDVLIALQKEIAKSGSTATKQLFADVDQRLASQENSMPCPLKS